MLIADSGSTKTDYRLIQKDGKILQIEGEGIHPYLEEESGIVEKLKKTFISYSMEEIGEVFYYGAGCSSEENKQKVHRAFASVFKEAKIIVEHDLLGAARAACGRNAGLAGILGTGSNCCIFDGEKIIEEFPTSGYILGDEGGGVFMGKKLLKDFIEERMPSDVRQSFDVRYKLSKHDILKRLSTDERPNKFMASFSMFIYHHRDHPYIHDIIEYNFQSFFDVQVKSFAEYQKYPLNLVGSIAFYFQEYIRSIADENDVIIGNVLEKPIAGLTLYHLPE